MSLQKIEQNYTHESLRLAHNETVEAVNTIQTELEVVKNSAVTPDSLPIAGETLGAVKSGGDVIIDENGVITVKDNSHNHTVENIEGLEDTLNSIDIPDAVIGSSDTGYITDACNASLIEMRVYGKSTQGYASHGGDPLGKNLLDINKFVPIQVEKITINKDNIVVTAGEYIYGIKLLDENLLTVGETYTFSVASVSSYGETKFGWRIAYTDDTYANTVDNTLTTTLTIEKPAKGAWFYVRMGETTTEDIIISKPQIEKGDTATEYEQYYSNPNPDCPVDIVSVGDDGDVSVTACGKNLIHCPYMFGTQNTNNGITYVSNDDGSITINGTSTNVSTVDLAINPSYFKAGQVYTISGKTENINVMVLFAGVVWGKDTFTVTEEMLQNSTSINVQIRIESDVTIDNATIYPQLEIGSAATEYEPYTGNTATITSGLPLCSVNDVQDELICNSDGTRKIIKHTKKTVYNGSEDWEYKAYANGLYRYSLYVSDIKIGINNAICDTYPQTDETIFANITTETCSSHPTGQSVNVMTQIATVDEWKTHLATNPITVIYTLNTPQEIELSVDEMSALQDLHTFDGVTNIYNNENAEIITKYWCDGNINALLNTKAPVNHTHTATEVGADPEGSANAALVSANAHTDELANGAVADNTAAIEAINNTDTGILAQAKTYAESYTNSKIDALVGEGASETLDTIGEISKAIEENQDVMDAINSAIGNKAESSALTDHTSNTSNPHNVTSEQIGLGNVENKSSATILSELTKENVINALGYTPPESDTTYTLSSFDITATAAELNILDGVTVSTEELNYVDGVTSNIQTQLNGKAASDHTHNEYISTAGATMEGALVAQANTDYTTAQVRNITMSTSEPSGGTNGQIHFQYS